MQLQAEQASLSSITATPQNECGWNQTLILQYFSSSWVTCASSLCSTICVGVHTRLELSSVSHTYRIMAAHETQMCSSIFQKTVTKSETESQMVVDSSRLIEGRCSCVRPWLYTACFPFLCLSLLCFEPRLPGFKASCFEWVRRKAATETAISRGSCFCAIVDRWFMF